MTSSPLHGTDLIDCAKANANKGIEVASQRCGYENDITTFERELKKAYDYIGVEFQGFSNMTVDRTTEQEAGVIIAPETRTQL